MTPDEHLSLAQLAAFAADATGRLRTCGTSGVPSAHPPADEHDEIAAHLEGCEQCSALYEPLRTLDEAWDGWTAKAHGQAYLEVVAHTALATVAPEADTPETEAWRERVAAWRRRWREGVGAFRVAVGSALLPIVEEIKALADPSSALAVMPATRRGSEGRSARPHGWVDVRRVGEDLSITLHDLHLREPASGPLVVLATTEEGGEARVASLERQPDGTYRACFQKVPEGDFVVLVEPVVRK